MVINSPLQYKDAAQENVESPVLVRDVSVLSACVRSTHECVKDDAP